MTNKRKLIIIETCVAQQTIPIIIGGNKMPPKLKFSREQIIAAAVNVTKMNGISGLTARAVATELGSSAKPIFGLFKNMEEVQYEVVNSANELYQSFLQNEMTSGKCPPYKASGMAYIKFAKDEKELFKLLFMRDRSEEKVEENREEIRPILNILMNNLGISEDEAYIFHMEAWVYAHGIATMLATSYLDWDMEFISNTLTDVYEGLKGRHTGGK